MKRRSTAIRPSGEVLPFVLRKAYNERIDQVSGDESCKMKLPSHPQVDKADQNQVFSVEELEQKMLQASSVMMEIQKQLYRGEEVYFEETQTHGNLFRGWDTFIDLKDVGIHAGAGAAPQPGGGARRTPVDNRWFSGSCTSVPRTSSSGSRPHSRLSVSRASTPSIIRSTADTPVSMATSPQPVAQGECINTADTTQQEINQQAGAPAVNYPPSDMPPGPQEETPQSTIVEPIVPLATAAVENAASAKGEEPVTPTAATPNRRGSTRKRKQGEN